MKERRQRVMGDFQSDAASEIDPIDYVIAERFKAERHPEQSVDGGDRWAGLDLFEEEGP
jgi:hypothetical protein